MVNLKAFTSMPALWRLYSSKINTASTNSKYRGGELRPSHGSIKMPATPETALTKLSFTRCEDG